MAPSKSPEYLLFNIAGAPEKDLAGTVVVNSLKAVYPKQKIVVTTHNPEVWLHNPGVYRVYKHGSVPYFYEDFVEGKDSIIFWQDPYKTSGYLHGTTHLIDAWCALCGVTRNTSSPKLYFTFREYEATMRMIGIEKKTRPLFLIQTESGVAPGQPHVWFRDMPQSIAREVTSMMQDRGYHTLQLRLSDQPLLVGAERLNLNLRQTLCAISFADKCLFVDSFAHHAAAAFGKHATVLWVTSTPKMHGYPLHSNILPDNSNSDFQTIRTAFHEQLNFTNAFQRTPYPMEKVYSSKKIVQMLLRDTPDHHEET